MEMRCALTPVTPPMPVLQIRWRRLKAVLLPLVDALPRAYRLAAVRGKAMPQPDRRRAAPLSDLSSTSIVSRALQSVPVIKYALGLAAISILFATARGAWPDVGISGMFPLLGGIMGLMILLIIVAAAGENRETTATPALVLVWGISLAFVTLLAMTISAIAIGKPRIWARLILPKEAVDAPLVAGGPVTKMPVTAPTSTPTPAPASTLPPFAMLSPTPNASTPKEAGRASGQQTDVDNKPVKLARLTSLAREADKLYAEMRRANPIFRAHNGFVFSGSDVNEGWLHLHFHSKKSVDPLKWNSQLFSSWADDIMCGPDLSNLTADGLQVEFMFDDDAGFSDSFTGLMCNFD